MSSSFDIFFGLFGNEKRGERRAFAGSRRSGGADEGSNVVKPAAFRQEDSIPCTPAGELAHGVRKGREVQRPGIRDGWDLPKNTTDRSFSDVGFS